MPPEPPTPPGEPLCATLAAIVGDTHVLVGSADTGRYASDQRGLYRGRPRAVVRPRTTAEVAAVVSACRRAGVAMVPQGGNTGYCGGATPDTSGSQLVISLERLDRVRALDAVNQSITLEAGVVLAAAQAHAADAGLLLPLSMGSEGSCQIGGNLSTNAGGLAVLRYGTARDLVLGLEVVLPDGRVLEQLRALRKDNTGYDLKQWFIGAEGTLGIITAATLKLFPAPTRHTTLFAAVPEVQAACRLLTTLRSAIGDNLTSFEYLCAEAVERVSAIFPELRCPLPATHAHYVLAECAAYGAAAPAAVPGVAHDGLAEVLEQALARGEVGDAAFAVNEAQRRAFWAVRERVPEAEKRLGGSLKHDIAVAVGDVPRFIAAATEDVRARWPQARLSVYGHIGDGNVHFNVLPPAAADGAAFKAQHGAAIGARVHALAADLGGSFSAEHGIGMLKRDLLVRYRGAVELDLMRALKRTLDPHALMNPGKVL